MRFSDDEIRRYSRQMVLPEVGGLGQERLRAARVSAATEVEALYLAAAGVGHLRVPNSAIAASVRALNPLVATEVDATLQPHGDAELDVEMSALGALSTLKRILELA